MAPNITGYWWFPPLVLEPSTYSRVRNQQCNLSSYTDGPDLTVGLMFFCLFFTLWWFENNMQSVEIGIGIFIFSWGSHMQYHMLSPGWAATAPEQPHDFEGHQPLLYDSAQSCQAAVVVGLGELNALSICNCQWMAMGLLGHNPIVSQGALAFTKQQAVGWKPVHILCQPPYQRGVNIPILIEGSWDLPTSMEQRQDVDQRPSDYGLNQIALLTVSPVTY